MLGVRNPVVDIVTRRSLNGQKNGVIQGFVIGVSGKGKYEREALHLGTAIGTGAKRLFKQRRNNTDPEQTIRSISRFVKKTDGSRRSVIDPVSGSNTGLARAAEKLRQWPSGKTRRIGYAETRRKITIPRR
jgi:hypothetical protein